MRCDPLDIVRHALVAGLFASLHQGELHHHSGVLNDPVGVLSLYTRMQILGATLRQMVEDAPALHCQFVVRNFRGRRIGI